ncbi:SPOR domain-containing protein [Nioella nitratireducens]|uniref:SPOR domain-containing protein n=1 Tax=Nioella nitratireducens TaxID=1287720 RepID=UPI0008FD2D97|nr:SPOR domain-containing protein [Nioella nitratireducens]
MADIDYYEESAPRSEAEGHIGASGLAVVVNWIGALLSVALVVGLSVWAWQLTVRDVSGVPVIRALQGSMRERPADPGGTIADHQGLAVNRISEGAEAAPAADRIVLAPAPLDLEEIDLTSASLPEDATPPTEGTSEETLALIDRLLEEAVPLDPVMAADGGSAPAAVEAEVAARPVIDVIPTTVPGVARSPRPPLRPEDVVQLASVGAPVASLTVTSTASAATDDVTDLDPEALANGTRLVQLGAFDDAETARAEWMRLAGLYPDFFRDKDRVVQAAMSGGREFFRLRAHGFDDLSDARRFCTALNAQGAPCIPVTVR